MLTNIRLQNFKSFEDQGVPLAPLTLLIGANASGKSNLLDAVRFLQGAALDLALADVLRGRWEGGREIWPGIRGGPFEAVRHGAASFTCETTWSVAPAGAVHSIECGANGGPLLARESLAPLDRQRPYFDTHADSLGAQAGVTPGGAIRVALRRARGGGGRSPSAEYSAHRSLLGQIQPQDGVDAEVMRVGQAVRDAMRSCLFLDITPRLMRGYVPKQTDRLGAQGENLSAVLWQLCQSEAEKRDLIDWLAELVAPELNDISFIETELGDVMLRLIEADGTPVSARSMSDGTLRFLGELAALRSAASGSLVLIEEIENGLHPKRAQLLVQLLDGMTRKRGVQVIATTHSPTVLATLPEDALKNAVAFARHADTRGSVMRRLGDIESFDTIWRDRGIERLFTTGWLERAL